MLTMEKLGFSNYSISKDGQVFSIKRNKNIAHRVGIKGYIHVQIYNDDGRCKNKPIHRLLALMYIENPENKAQVNHINEIKHDYRLSNLEWATQSENMIHSRSKHVELLSPSGEITLVRSLATFARKNNLNQPLLWKVAYGGAPHHKGWRNPAHNTGSFNKRLRNSDLFHLLDPFGKKQ